MSHHTTTPTKTTPALVIVLVAALILGAVISTTVFFNGHADADDKATTGTPGGHLQFGPSEGDVDFSYHRVNKYENFDTTTETGVVCANGAAYLFIWIDQGSGNGPAMSPAPNLNGQCSR